MSEPAKDPVITFFGVALLGVGLLMGTLSGLCTGIALVISLFSGRDGIGIAGMALIVGGVPLLIGLGLAWAGRAILRSQASSAAPRDDAP